MVSSSTVCSLIAERLKHMIKKLNTRLSIPRLPNMTKNQLVMAIF